MRLDPRLPIALALAMAASTASEAFISPEAIFFEISTASIRSRMSSQNALICFKFFIFLLYLSVVPTHLKSMSL